MTFPKSNLLYSSGASNTALSLFDGSNHASAVIQVAGVSYNVDTTQSFMVLGTGFNVDTVIWGL